MSLFSKLGASISGRRTNRRSRSRDRGVRPSVLVLEDRCLLSGVNLVGSTFFGGSGDQRGTAITVQDDQLFLSGSNALSGGQSLALSYAIAADGSAPTLLWNTGWPPTGSSPAGAELFAGVDATEEAVYFAGQSYRQTSDGVGGKEFKSVLATYNPDGPNGPGVGGTESVSEPHFFSYRGIENYTTVITQQDASGDAVYSAGLGEETGFGGYRTILAKHNPDGSIAWKRKYATDTSGNQIAGTSTRISSGATSLVWLNGYLYIAGFDRAADQVGGPPGQAMLLKYDAAAQPPDANPNADGAAILVPEWARVTGFSSSFEAITAIGDAIYVVGSKSGNGGPDFLIQKYDEAGNLLWSTESGGAGRDELYGIVSVGNRVFAVGYTTSEGAGGRDVVVLEIDPNNGAILSTTLYGSAQDDQANDVATDGKYLYVVGESRSFAESGNAVGQNDVLLLQFAISANTQTIAIDVKPGSEVNPVNLQSRGVLPVAILSTPEFDATTVDISTIQFGDVRDGFNKVSPIRSSVEDVNGDGNSDLILHFSMRDIIAAGAIVSDTTQVGLVAVSSTSTGSFNIQGMDAVRIVPASGEKTNNQDSFALLDLAVTNFEPKVVTPLSILQEKNALDLTVLDNVFAELALFPESVRKNRARR